MCGATKPGKPPALLPPCLPAVNIMGLCGVSAEVGYGGKLEPTEKGVSQLLIYRRCWSGYIKYFVAAALFI